jgi:hypothetical protein
MPYRDLLASEIKRDGLFREPEWFEHLMRNYFNEHDELRLYGVEDTGSGRPLLLSPLRHTTSDRAVRKGRVIGSISNPENYTTAALIFDPETRDPVHVLRGAVQPLPGQGARGAWWTVRCHTGVVA